MADLEEGVGTWYNRSTGAFIKELQEGCGAASTFFSPQNRDFVLREMRLQLELVEGRSVRYEACDQVATRVEPLTKVERS